MVKNSEAKNALETQLYNFQDRKSEEWFVNFSSETEKETLNTWSDETEAFLYSSEAKNANHTVFDQKNTSDQQHSKKS